MFNLPWKRDRKPTFDAPLAPEEAFFVIGDVHGRSDLLVRLVTRLDSVAPANMKLIFVGDYIDRGEDSAGVLATLHRFHTGSAPGSMICLRGNHEQMLIDFLDKPEERGARWLRYGGLQTLASYQVGLGSGTPQETDWADLRDRLRYAISPEIETWLRAMPLSWKSGNVFVCHAGADPALSVDRQERRTLLWGTPAFEETTREDGQWVVFGHTIHDHPAPTDGRIPVDTGAYATGRLTAAMIEPGHVEFIST